MKKFTALALVGAMTAAMAVPALADGTVDGTLTYDVSNGWFDSSDEWGQVWLQAWGGTLTVNSAYVTLSDGTTVDATYDSDYTIVIIGDGAVVDDYSTVASVTYVVSYDETEYNDEETWIGGGIGTNSASAGWVSVEWGKASGEKAIAIEDYVGTAAEASTETTDDASADGDTTPVAYLAAVVALAGVALVASKKVRA